MTRTVFEAFAMTFHQDIMEDFTSMDAVVDDRIGVMSKETRAELRKHLERELAKSSGENSLYREWRTYNKDIIFRSKRAYIEFIKGILGKLS